MERETDVYINKQIQENLIKNNQDKIHFMIIELLNR